MQSHDIDLIFRANGILIHCATNCALIPTKARTIKMLNAIRKQVLSAENIFTENDISINEARVDSVIKTQRDLIAQFNRHLTDNEDVQLISPDSAVNIEISDKLIRRNYITTFIGIAMKGLHSYDYISSTVTDKGIVMETFELVAKPNDDLIPEDNFIHDILGDIEVPDLSNIVSLTGNQLEILIEPIK